MKYLKATLLGSGALASLLLSSVLTGCQDEDFGYTVQEIRDAAYDRNFIAHFGEIAPDMDWDLTRQKVGATGTRANIGSIGSYETLNNWYYVDSKVVETFNDLLPEADGTNKYKGQTGFELESNGTFYIIPVYQGQSGLNSALHMVVQNGDDDPIDIKLWDRSQNIQRQTVGSFEWKDLSYDWQTLLGTNEWTYFPTIDWYQFTSNGVYIASTRAAAGIRTKPIKCIVPVGAKLDFYLEITQGHVNYGKTGSDFDRIANSGIGNYNTYFKEHSGYNFNISANWSEANLAFTGDKMWASKGKMIKLDQVDGLKIPDIEKLAGDDPQYYFIACEDAISKGERTTTEEYTSHRNYVNGEEKKEGTYTKNQDNKAHVVLTTNDWEGDDDMNDLVFLFVSGKLPEPKNPGNVKKRYIIEDLGSVVDWDFNDIIVDMEQITDAKTGNKTQKATLKHLCGTTPFELFVGPVNDEDNSVKLDFSGDGLSMATIDGDKQVIDGQVLAKDVELNYEFHLPQAIWDSKANNIWVRVYPLSRYNNSKHPEGGSYEYTNDKNDSFGGTMDQNYNNSSVGNGEINSTFDYGRFIDFAFPRKGKVPRIIAVNPDHEWTEEHQDIDPATWTVYKLNVTTTGGNGDVWGEGIYKPNTSVDIKAKAAEGYRFVQWNDGNISANRTVTVTGSNTYTATFEKLREEWSMSNPNSPTPSSIRGYGDYSLDAAELEKALDYGYNTLVLYSNKACDLGISLNGSTDYIVKGDAVNYKVTQQGSEYKTEIVLTEAQITAIKNNNYNLCVRGRVGGENTTELSNVSIKKNDNTFTVKLLGIDNWKDVGTVSASDRTSYDWGDGDSNPYIRNGGNDFTEASYYAGQTVTLTPNPKSGYAFDHWEQYDNKGVVINTDKGGTNGAITVQSSAILKAVFKQTGVIKYTATTGETIQIGYRQKGSTGSFTAINSGSGSNVLGSTAQDYEFGIVSVTLNGSSITKYISDVAQFVVDWTNGSNTTKSVKPDAPVTYNWNPNDGLSINLSVRYIVNAVPQLNDNNSDTGGKVVIRANGSDETFNNQAYYVNGTTVSLTAVPNDGFGGYKFNKWGDGTTSPSRSHTVNGPKVMYAKFVAVGSNILWQSPDGAAAPFNKFAYGNEDKLINKLPANGSQKIRFTFKEATSGQIIFMTPYEKVENDQLQGGWTKFKNNSGTREIHIYDMDNYEWFDVTFTENQISRIKTLGGLILQYINNSGNEGNLIITEVSLINN